MTTQTVLRRITTVTAAVFTVLALSTTVRADVFTSNPSLPVLFPSGYYTNGAAHATYSVPGVNINLTNLGLSAFSPVVLTPSGSNESEAFNPLFMGDGAVLGLGHLAFTASGNATMITYNKIGKTTGTFNTEMLAMSLSASTAFGPLLIRESPTLASVGQTTVTALGGGQYQISSFFGVFTELSLDGGATWIPDSGGSERITLLGPVPEPSTFALAGVAAGLLALKRMRWFGKQK